MELVSWDICVNGCAIREGAFGSEPGPEGLTRRLLKEIAVGDMKLRMSQVMDSTPQVISLLGASLQGFQVLVEMEWLDFGHKFADRCGHGENSDDLNERCPVFLQWLDCVHQLQRQFPCSFEFNEAFLVSSDLMILHFETHLHLGGC